MPKLFKIALCWIINALVILCALTLVAHLIKKGRK